MAARVGTDPPENDGGIQPLNVPRPLAVDADDEGVPVAVSVRGTLRRVRAIHDSWRIDDEWWRSEISRRYWDVETEDARNLTVYQDLVTGEWFEQRY
jgi:hypothetical protein